MGAKRFADTDPFREGFIAKATEVRVAKGTDGMKVLVLVPPMENAGGIQRYSATLVRALNEIVNDWDVKMLAIQRPQSKRIGEQTGLGLRVKSRFVLQTLWGAAYWKPDLVICTHVGLAPIGWLLRALWQCSYWVAAHGIEVWGTLSFEKQSALRKADKVLAVSAFTSKRLIERHLISPEQITILPNALNDSLLNIPPRKEFLAPLNINGRRVILTVGRLASSERYKGHDTVIRALVRVRMCIPDVVYVIVGDGDDRDRLAALIQRLGVQDQVVFAGRACDEDLVACYQTCGVFVLPAKTVLDDNTPGGEGFGIVFLEAMAFGKPVIGPNYGAPSEFIRHGEHGLLVDPEDPEAVAQALIQLLTSPERAHQMGESARQLVISEYSYERFRERLHQLLTNHISDGRQKLCVS